jgi:hypothetical protein
MEIAARAEGPFGELLFPRAGATQGAWRDMEVPMLAADTRLEGPWAPAAQAVLDEEGLALDRLRVPGVRRPAFREARNTAFRPGSRP